MAVRALDPCVQFLLWQNSRSRCNCLEIPDSSNKGETGKMGSHVVEAIMLGIEFSLKSKALREDPFFVSCFFERPSLL